MKLLVQIWRILSFPLILVGLVLTWYGIQNWSIASADKIVSAKELAVQPDDVVVLHDSLRYDLSAPSIRQLNIMGITSEPTAVFPAWAGTDSGLVKIVVVSSQPRFLGPAVKSFMRIDSAGGAIKVQSSEKNSEGSVVPKFEALIQIQAMKLGKAKLEDSVRGRFLAHGTAIRKYDGSNTGLDSIAGEYWEVRLEGTPGRGKVMGFFALGIACIVLGIVLQIVVKKRDVRLAEEDEEERLNEQPLV